MKLIDCEIWESLNCLYIKTPNDQLVKLTGESVNKVKLIIKSIVSKVKIPSNSDITLPELNEIYTLFLALGIIQEEKKENEVSLKVGVYADKSLLSAMKSQIPEYNMELIQNINLLENYDLIVVVSPFYPDHTGIVQIGYNSYQEQIPLLFCEFSSMSFVIGPLVLPKQHTPSLNCYLKRRTVNAKSPKLFAEMISQHSEPILKSKFEDYYYNDVYLNLLCEEISKFLKFDGSYSMHLVGMSITTNFVTYEIEKSRVLKDPMSKLFVKTPFVPFNG